MTRRVGPDEYRELLRRGTMSVGRYTPQGEDKQSPHEQDEVYIVERGRAVFAEGERRTEIGPGDVLFAAAGGPHRFEDFSDDFAAWVVFYGPSGGEAAEGEATAGG